MSEDIFDEIVKEEGVLESDEDFQALVEEDQPEETPEDSSPEKTETKEDSEPSEYKKDDDEEKDEDKSEKTEEKPLPFHEHPRWKQLQDELKDLREFKDKAGDLPDKVEDIQKSQQSKTKELPQWWVTLVGNDEAAATAFEQYDSYNQQQQASIKKEAIAEYEQQQQQASLEQKRWDKWVDDEVEALKSEGNTFDRNALLKVATEWQPTDEHGNVSLRKSLEILKMQESANKPAVKPNEERKKVAALTTSTNKGGTETTTKTPNMHSLRGKSMQELLHGNNKN